MKKKSEQRDLELKKLRVATSALKKPLHGPNERKIFRGLGFRVRIRL